MTVRPCLECRRLTSNRSGRCDEHEAMARRQHHNPQYDSADWRRRSAATLAAWRSQHGERCPGYDRWPHFATPDNPLTTDHPLALARGGGHDQPLGVLCRECNGRKAARPKEDARADR